MTVDEMLEKMDLHAVLMMQGMLVNRGLKLLHEQKVADVDKSQLLLPDSSIVKP